MTEEKPIPIDTTFTTTTTVSPLRAEETLKHALHEIRDRKREKKTEPPPPPSQPQSSTFPQLSDFLSKLYMILTSFFILSIIYNLCHIRSYLIIFILLLIVTLIFPIISDTLFEHFTFATTVYYGYVRHLGNVIFKRTNLTHFNPGGVFKI